MTPSAPAIRLHGLRKEFAGTPPVVAVDGADLEIATGEFFSMLGPSGSGKTTVLRMIAGFEEPTAGTVELVGEDVTALPPYRRDVNTVFQDYALFPHMSVLAQRRVRPARQEGLRRRGAPPRPGGPRAGAPRRPRRPPPRPALRWPAPAGRAGPRAGQPPAGAAARRAARRARPQAARADAGRAQGDPARRRHHLPVRHPRPGGGADPLATGWPCSTPAGSSRSAPRARSTSSRPAGSSPGSSAPPTCSPGAAARAVLGRDGSFGIRPEKIHLEVPGAPAEDGAVRAPGTIAEVVYAGPVTRYVVDLDAGGRLVVLEQNGSPQPRPRARSAGHRSTCAGPHATSSRSRSHN